VTFNELVQNVLARAELTSNAAQARVEAAINSMYGRVTSRCGIDHSSRRETVTANTVIGSKFVTINGIEKLLLVRNSEGRPLDEKTVHQLDQQIPTTSAPAAYAVYRVGSNTVTIQLDCNAQSVQVLTCSGLEVSDTLSGSLEPAFPRSFHYIIAEGVLEQEFRKKGKDHIVLAQMAKAEYEDGVNRLALYLDSSAMLVVRQGEAATGARRVLDEGQ
jgi:hypothetical protein